MTPSSIDDFCRSIVRIRTQAGRTLGSGFVLESASILTAMHIFRDAVDGPNDIYFDMPFLSSRVITGSFVARLQTSLGPLDACLIRPEELPPEHRCLPLLKHARLAGASVQCCGFPAFNPNGLVVRARTGDLNPDGLATVESIAPGSRAIAPGFSGSPLWDPVRRVVLGIILQADLPEERRVAYFLPSIDIASALQQHVGQEPAHHFPSDLLAGVDLVHPALHRKATLQLQHHTGSPDSAVPFFGRDYYSQRLTAWLESPTPYALIHGDSGSGKSSLIAHWATEAADSDRAQVAYCPISSTVGITSKNDLAKLLTSRLAWLEGRVLQAEEPFDSDHLQNVLQSRLSRGVFGEPPLLIVLDGIDEARDWHPADFLPPSLSAGIKVLASTRTTPESPPEEAIGRFRWEQTNVESIRLVPLFTSDLRDILESLGGGLPTLASDDSFVDEFFNITQGSPFLVRLYLEDFIRSGASGVDASKALKEMPSAISRHFTGTTSHTRDDLNAIPAQIVWKTLAGAFGPLSVEEIAEINTPDSLSSLTISTALVQLDRLLTGSFESGYSFFHPLLRKYVWDRLTDSERSAVDERFLKFGERLVATPSTASTLQSDYIAEFYTDHIQRGASNFNQFSYLISHEWQGYCDRVGKRDGFVKCLKIASDHLQREAASPSMNAPEVILQRIRLALLKCSVNPNAGALSKAIVLVPWMFNENLSVPMFKINQPLRRFPEFLSVLATSLTDHSVKLALLIAEFLNHPTRACDALLALIPRLSQDDLTGLLKRTEALRGTSYRSRVRLSIANRFADLGHYRKALSAGAMIDDCVDAASFIGYLKRQQPSPRILRRLSQIEARIALGTLNLPPLSKHIAQSRLSVQSPSHALDLTDHYARAISDFSGTRRDIALREVGLTWTHTGNLQAARPLVDAITHPDIKADFAAELLSISDNEEQQGYAQSLSDPSKSIEDERFLSTLARGLATRGCGALARQVAVQIRNSSYRARAICTFGTEFGVEFLTPPLFHLNDDRDQISYALTYLKPAASPATAARITNYVIDSLDHITDEPMLFAVLCHLANDATRDVVLCWFDRCLAFSDGQLTSQAGSMLLARLARLGFLEEALERTTLLECVGGVAEALLRIACSIDLVDRRSEILEQAMRMIADIHDVFVRTRLWALATRCGLTEERASDLVARIIADLREATEPRPPEITPIPNDHLWRIRADSDVIRTRSQRAAHALLISEMLECKFHEQILREGLALARSGSDKFLEIKFLVNLATHVKEERDLTLEAIRIVDQIDDDHLKVAAQTWTGSNLLRVPESHFSETFYAWALPIAEFVCEVRQPSLRADIVTNFGRALAKMPVEKAVNRLFALLEEVEGGVREVLVHDLIALGPAIVHLAGQNALSAICDAILEAGERFP